MREVLTRPADGPDLVLRYADHADGLVDVYLPPALGAPPSPHPLLLLFHGGFWRQEYDRVHVRPMAHALARLGWVVATPEYRRVGGLGGWPATGYDAEDALAVIPAMTEAVAPGQVDPSAPCTLIGHSAGGHLAMWAGLRAGPGRVRSVVALAPVSDLRYAAACDMGDGAVQDLLGGGPEEALGNYAEADVLARLPGQMPITIIQGTDDKEVTVEMNRRIAASRSHPAEQPHVEYVECEGVDHFALIDPLSAAFHNAVLPALSGASARCDQ